MNKHTAATSGSSKLLLSVLGYAAIFVTCYFLSDMVLEGRLLGFFALVIGVPLFFLMMKYPILLILAFLFY